jgi:hypothetical protein
LAGVLERAAAYVRHFRTQFESVIADEWYEQEASFVENSPEVSSDRVAERTVRKRYMESEFVLVFMASRGVWLGFRDVISVDGRRVADRDQRRARLLIRRRDHTHAELRAITDESARFNIGHVERNTNQPLFVLMFVDAANQARFSFERAGTRRIDGVRTWAIRYRERTRPTIVQGAGGDLVSEGTIWLDPANGHVLQTEHQLKDEKVSLRTMQTVRFRPDRRFDINVPAQMLEEYRQFERHQGSHTICRARYSNFRRFEVESKLIVPK